RKQQLTEEDSALYICKINGSLYRHIRVHVKGCSLSDPGQLELRAAFGQAVLLPCSCSDPQATPSRLTWTVGSRLGVIEMWSTLSSKWSDVYRHRAVFSNSTSGDLSVLLSNFTKSDEGVYVCKIMTHNKTEQMLTFLSGQQDSVPPAYSHIAVLLLFTVPLAVGFHTYNSVRKKQRGDSADSTEGHEIAMELTTCDGVDVSRVTTIHNL
ncbi:uncharacterized protein LOC124471968, partial [Hypomesus transpacificus]|uniref:uncharacterized protein LOC124471968 n=1 Tax=Hypomesus transpacificus TaxID=137520 RepID=UPI001F0770B7